MNISKTIRFVCFTILLLATQFRAAAQSGFTDAEAEAIQAFLRENFGNTNAGTVIGLVDECGSRVFAAGKSTAECFNLLRANGSPKVGLELVNQEWKETNTVELTRGKFLTSS